MNSRLSSGEMYNPDTKVWTALPDMMVQPQPGRGAREAGGDWWLPEDRDYKQGRGAGQWTGLPTPRRRWRKESAARLSDMASEEESGLLAPEWVGLNPGVGVLFSLQAVALDAGVAAALA